MKIEITNEQKSALQGCIKILNEILEEVEDNDVSPYKFNLPDTPNKYYLSSNNDGNGSLESPWNFFKFFDGEYNGEFKPNATFYVMDGVYRRRSLLSIERLDQLEIRVLGGSPENPIIIRPLNKRKVTIDCGISINFFGRDEPVDSIWLVGFEIAISEPMHLSGSNTITRPLGGVWFAGGRNCKIINNIIHRSTSSGLNIWSHNNDTEVYGNIIYDNGNVRSDRAHGHGVYTQNKAPSIKTYMHNIIVRGPQEIPLDDTFALQCYGSGNAYVEDIDVIENVLLGSVVIGKNSGPSNNISFNGNYIDKGAINFGYTSDTNGSLNYNGNILTWGALTFRKWDHIDYSRNICYATDKTRTIWPNEAQYHNIIENYSGQNKDIYKIFANEYDNNQFLIVCLDLDYDKKVVVNLKSFIRIDETFKIFKYNDLNNPVISGLYESFPTQIELDMFEPNFIVNNLPAIINPFILEVDRSNNED